MRMSKGGGGDRLKTEGDNHVERSLKTVVLLGSHLHGCYFLQNGSYQNQLLQTKYAKFTLRLDLGYLKDIGANQE